VPNANAAMRSSSAGSEPGSGAAPGRVTAVIAPSPSPGLGAAPSGDLIVARGCAVAGNPAVLVVAHRDVLQPRGWRLQLSRLRVLGIRQVDGGRAPELARLGEIVRPAAVTEAAPGTSASRSSPDAACLAAGEQREERGASVARDKRSTGDVPIARYSSRKPWVLDRQTISPKLR